ncbi:hypothetical protein HRbin16_01946 [bacterium HR16]|nr:hypothetical protein HRbin16_01946 [bacterium HR16]
MAVEITADVPGQTREGCEQTIRMLGDRLMDSSCTTATLSMAAGVSWRSENRRRMLRSGLRSTCGRTYQLTSSHSAKQTSCTRSFAADLPRTRTVGADWNRREPSPLARGIGPLGGSDPLAMSAQPPNRPLQPTSGALSVDPIYHDCEHRSRLSGMALGRQDDGGPCTVNQFSEVHDDGSSEG